MRWSKLTPAELERRRLASVEAMTARYREEFELWYQEECDRLYWSIGPCCAGCDHWRSRNAMIGQCAAAGVVSGADVMRSMDIEWSSYRFPPGLPYTRGESHCGKFRDDFDWSSLDQEYLSRIGAKADAPHE